MGNLWEIYGKFMGKLWKNYGKIMEKVWKNYGKIMVAHLKADVNAPVLNGNQ